MGLEKSMKKKYIFWFLPTLLILSIAVFLFKHELKNETSHPPLNIIFQNLHFEEEWSITNGASLWTFFIINNITEPLIRVDNNTDLIAALSSRWTFSEDKKILKFSIAEGYTFHDGKPIRPIDVLESLKRIFSSKDVHHSEVQKFLAGSPEEAIRIDGRNIEIRFKEPLNALSYQFANPEMGIAPQDYAQGKSLKQSLYNLSGPYQVTSFSPKEMILEKHPEGHPLLDRDSPNQVRIVEVPDGDDAIHHYNEHDSIILTGSGYAGASKALNLEGQKTISAPAFTEFFLPNIDSEKLDTKDKRKTVFSAIKRAFFKIPIDERIAERTNQFFTLNNIARVKEERLDDLYGKGAVDEPIKLSVLLFQYMQDTPIIAPLAEELEPLGIKLEIMAPNDDSEASRIFETKNYDLLYVYFGSTNLDPLMELIFLFNYKWTDFPYKNAQLVAALERAKTETDRKTYVSLLKDIHAGLIKNYRILPVMHTKMVYSVKGSYQLKELNYFDGVLNLWDWRKI